jgi:hypothetical protein
LLFVMSTNLQTISPLFSSLASLFFSGTFEMASTQIKRIQESLILEICVICG